MMNALVLARRMQDAGMPQAEAEALANGIDEYMQANVATKADVENVRAELKVAVSDLKHSMLQTCITVCGAVGVLQISIIYALIMKLGHM